MNRTDNLRRQHDAALALVTEIVDEGRYLSGDSEAERGARASVIAMQLSKLTGLLRIHFAQEDRMLYPRLMRSADAETAAVATRFFDEMGGLGAAYEQFAERWTRLGAIAAAPDAFIAEAESVFAALGNRIERENRELYPLADRPAQDFCALPQTA